MKLLVLLSLLVGSAAFAEKVPMYDSEQMVLKLSNDRVMHMIMNPGAQFSGYSVHLMDIDPYSKNSKYFDCGKVLERSRKGYEFTIKLVCKETKGKLVSTDTIQLDIHAKINKELHAEGYLYFGRMVSRFEAFDPATVK